MPSLSEILFGAYLRWTGKRHLTPLLKSLKHAGRPADIAFPGELMEQGLSLVLAGLNNTLAMQSNSSWVWPYWVERQIDPGSEAFLPTGTNVIQSNLTARNWTALGVDGSQREAMIDPVGMVTLRPYGWSWFPYLRIEGENFFPPRLTGVRQELLDGTLPAVLTHYPLPAVHAGIAWSSECIALRGLEEEPESGSETATVAPAAQESRGGEWLLCTHHLRNLSDRPVSVTFGIALRPYNPLMFSPIGAIRYVKTGERDAVPGAVPNAKPNAAPGLESGVFRVNGKAALVLPEAPQRVTLSNRWQGDSLLHPDRGLDNGRMDSNSGVLSAAAEYHWTLAPGEARSLPSLGLISRKKPYPAHIPSGEQIVHLRAAERARLHRAESTGMQIEIPHAELAQAFRAVKGRLNVFDDGKHFSPGTFLYHGHWFRDAAFIALAFDQMGFGRRVAAKMEEGLKRQDWRGFFRSQNGEWDSNGQALWTLIGHVQRGGDPELLRRAWPALRRGGRWIDAMRRRTRTRVKTPHFGLLPAGFSAEHFGPNDHYYWDNLWSLAGLEKLLWAARLLGRTREVARLEILLADYRTDVEASMQEAFRRAEVQGLPCSPYRDLDSAAVGNLVGIAPLGVVDPDAPWVAGTLEFLARNNLHDGLFLQKIIHTGLNSYLSAQMARALLVRQDPRAFEMLEALLRHGGPTLAWPEAIHPRTGGGCMGDGDHGWAASEFLNLIRDLLVREEKGEVLLCSGVTARWFTLGAVLGVTDAPTLHGTVSYRIQVEPEGLKVKWSCRRQVHQDPATIVLCMPAASPQKRVRLEGDAGQIFIGRRNHDPEF